MSRASCLTVSSSTTGARKTLLIALYRFFPRASNAIFSSVSLLFLYYIYLSFVFLYLSRLFVDVFCCLVLLGGGFFRLFLRRLCPIWFRGLKSEWVRQKVREWDLNPRHVTDSGNFLCSPFLLCQGRKKCGCRLKSFVLTSYQELAFLILTLFHFFPGFLNAF